MSENTVFQKNLDTARQIIDSHTYPIITLDKNNVPDIIGSGIFLHVFRKVFLVTAAHVLRNINSNLFTKGQKTLIELTGNPILSKHTETDEIDIGFMQIKSEFVERNALNIITYEKQITSVIIENPHSRAVSGFLASKNKQAKSVNIKNKSVTSFCYTFFGHAESNLDYTTFNKNEKLHRHIEFGAGTDDKGRRITTPPWKPIGLSGGGMWLIPDIGKPTQIFLEGIFISAKKQSKRMIGFSTKLEEVFKFINFVTLKSNAL